MVPTMSQIVTDGRHRASLASYPPACTIFCFGNGKISLHHVESEKAKERPRAPSDCSNIWLWGHFRLRTQVSYVICSLCCNVNLHPRPSNFTPTSVRGGGHTHTLPGCGSWFYPWLAGWSWASCSTSLCLVSSPVKWAWHRMYLSGGLRGFSVAVRAKHVSLRLEQSKQGREHFRG